MWFTLFEKHFRNGTVEMIKQPRTKTHKKKTLSDIIPFLKKTEVLKKNKKTFNALILISCLKIMLSKLSFAAAHGNYSHFPPPFPTAGTAAHFP